MDRYEFQVGEMCCGHCEETITDAVSRIAGISRIDANSDTETVIVTADTATKERIQQAIQDAGFQVPGER